MCWKEGVYFKLFDLTAQPWPSWPRKLWQPWNRKSCLSEVIQKVFMRGKRPMDRALRWPTSLLKLWTEISNIGRISLVLRGETGSAATWSPTRIQCCEGNECGSLKLLAYGNWGDTQIDAVDIYRGLELISLKPEVAQNICKPALYLDFGISSRPQNLPVAHMLTRSRCPPSLLMSLAPSTTSEISTSSQFIDNSYSFLIFEFSWKSTLQFNCTSG